MFSNVKRVFVEKKSEYDIYSENLLKDIKINLGVNNLENIRVLNIYDLEFISEKTYDKIKNTILSEPPVDNIFEDNIKLESDEILFATEYLAGQYDQRADSAMQCIQIIEEDSQVLVHTAKLFVLKGNISQAELDKIKKYIINPVETREFNLERPKTLKFEFEEPKNISLVKNFLNMNNSDLNKLSLNLELAMNIEDLEFCQKYFKETEKREPTITEIRLIDTYWSDHCRHTTFATRLENIEIEDGFYKEIIQKAFDTYLKEKEELTKDKDICLMDIATIGMKSLRKKGFLENLDISEEINACSITANVDVNGKDEEWLIMFKNETHNHPTEIEPFGGAATCLGGAIRDPLSGRAYVYQAMRVTGAADPRVKIEDTLSGKLPQRKITQTAALGYSSYGNQIGIATGQVSEIYHQGYLAKRMEVGAVVGANKKENVVRSIPLDGDLILLVGGRTGRDGCGGATGSSKEHTEESLKTCGAEVQKGNAPTERKLQRLFRNPKVSKIIKRCNDFGAGGVSVAIGELAQGVDVNLDCIPKKYEGLDGTELAISESQERMAVVISPESLDQFIKFSEEENLEASLVAKVTSSKRVRMFWRGEEIVNLSRDFLDTNGVTQRSNVFIKNPKSKMTENILGVGLKEKWLKNLQDLNVCSQKGLVENFDSTIGARTVLMPFGGKRELTPSETMVSKIPVFQGDTSTVSIMSFGCNPHVAMWSPFHSAVYAVVESICKIVATGGDYTETRLSFQEYFEKLGNNSEKWGKPFSALIGALYTQLNLKVAAIGGKDSMSGSFNQLDVPPTFISFALNMAKIDNIISPEFKKLGSKILILKTKYDKFDLPIFENLIKNFEKVNSLIKDKKVISAATIGFGGVAAAISKMSFGNYIGANIKEYSNLFSYEYGSFVLEVDGNIDLESEFQGLEYFDLGYTIDSQEIIINNEKIKIYDLEKAWNKPLEKVFPTKICDESKEIELSVSEYKTEHKTIRKTSFPKPKIFIPVFAGTNCEYDMERAFEKAGGKADTLVFKNLNRSFINDSIDEMVKKIQSSQIIALSGGFSAADEPDGSGKFIATIFRNSKVKEAVMDLIQNRDGLIIGICNGFQALIKLGLLPYGEIRQMDKQSPTLTFNTISRHVSSFVNTKIISNKSPWFSKVNVGEIYKVPVSHGEGRFISSESLAKDLIKNGQIATQYVDEKGKPTYDIKFNPNGSYLAVEGITSKDGRILGKMGHSERMGNNLYKNIIGKFDDKIFESGISYFK